jgi:hypothetical protein
MNRYTLLGQVCSLEPVERLRRWRKVKPFLATAIARVELPNGVRLEFDAGDDAELAVRDFVRAECTCCSRFTYAVTELESPRRIALDIGAAEPDLVALKTLYLR